MKMIIALFLLAPALAQGKDIFNELVSVSTLTKDATKIIGNIGLNCAEPTKLPANIKQFVDEFKSIVQGLGRLTTETAALLALKKDFPQFCHVMTKAQINSYQEETNNNHESKCILKAPLGKCLLKKDIKKERPNPSYFIPKYFIEISEKGNDPHPAFARENILYTANRKIATALTKYVDPNGAINLAKTVMGGKALLSTVGIDTGQNNLGELGKAKALTPFEKLRIRASKKSDISSFDFTIWPVVASDLWAEHFTVCGRLLKSRGKNPGGYGWPFKGVPQTCPLVHVNDLYWFWDTGMLDYMDPETMSAMAIGSNPLTCGAAQGTSLLGNLGASSPASIGEKSRISGALSGLTDNLNKALRSCSWPILGNGQAITSKALEMTKASKWKSSKCTFWGPTAPRQSQPVLNNDYSYANTALKAKLLSHELMGLKRGNGERWSLAYPWEGPGSSTSGSLKLLSNLYDKFKGTLGSNMSKMGIDPKFSDTGVSRSEGLFTPGNPLLIDTSFSKKHIENLSTNFLKEAGYIAGLYAAGATAKNQVEKAGAQHAFTQLEQDFNKFEDEFSDFKLEPVWKAVDHCFIGNNRIHITKGKYFQLGNEKLPFSENVTRKDCHSTNSRYIGCVSGWSGGHECTNPSKIRTIYVKRMVKVGTRKARNPRYIKYGYKCKEVGRKELFSHVHWFGSRYKWVHDETHVRIECDPVEIRDEEAYAKSLQKPDPKKYSTLTRNSDTNRIIAQAAEVSTWIGAEVARARYSEMLGKNPVPGDRRIYTVWEKISCEYPSTRLTVKTPISPTLRFYESCSSAIRFELLKYIQLKFIRKICDALGEEVGKPWK